MTTPLESEQLIQLIIGQTRDLLRNYWPDIETYRNGDTEIKLSFSHALSYEGSQRTVKTTIRFSHRITDEVENSIDTAQEELPLPVQKDRRK